LLIARKALSSLSSKHLSHPLVFLPLCLHSAPNRFESFLSARLFSMNIQQTFSSALAGLHIYYRAEVTMKLVNIVNTNDDEQHAWFIFRSHQILSLVASTQIAQCLAMLLHNSRIPGSIPGSGHCMCGV